MKGKTHFSGLILTSMLLAGLCLAVFPQISPSGFANASSILPDSNTEYANGTIVSALSPLNVWYDWVNVSGTQVINYALYTPSDYAFPVPIASIVGQHLHLADGNA